VNTYRARLIRCAGAGLAGSALLCLLAAPTYAVSPASAGAPHHNARVAEYLMQTHTGLNDHNARVAEYLLMRHSR
jgi:hypothetical protein